MVERVTLLWGAECKSSLAVLAKMLAHVSQNSPAEVLKLPKYSAQPSGRRGRCGETLRRPPLICKAGPRQVCHRPQRTTQVCSSSSANDSRPSNIRKRTWTVLSLVNVVVFEVCLGPDFSSSEYCYANAVRCFVTSCRTDTWLRERSRYPTFQFTSETANHGMRRDDSLTAWRQSSKTKGR